MHKYKVDGHPNHAEETAENYLCIEGIVVQRNSWGEVEKLHDEHSDNARPQVEVVDYKVVKDFCEEKSNTEFLIYPLRETH